MPPKDHRGRILLIAVAAVSLITALWAGLVRLGWNLPVLNIHFALLHGPLMVVGFVGTLIGLERAVALGKFWSYGVPLLSGLAVLSMLAGLPSGFGPSLALAASLLLIAIFVTLYRQYPSEHFLIMALSATALLVGNGLWLYRFPLFKVVPWWVGFLVLMIAGERLELTRMRRPSVPVRAAFRVSVGLTLGGLAWSSVDFRVGIQIAGFGLLSTGLWLLRFDIAWRSLRQTGLSRFMGICLLSGYVWLGVSGLFWLLLAQDFQSGPRYDAMLHTIFLGFVFSMIFAHAPIIFPSISGMALPFSCAFYLHLVLLHLSLLLRITGDLLLWVSAYRWGGLLNIVAVVIFLGNNIYAVRVGREPDTGPARI